MCLVDSYGDFSFGFSVSVSLSRCSTSFGLGISGAGIMLMFHCCAFPLLSWARCDLLRNHVHYTVYFMYTVPLSRCNDFIFVFSMDPNIKHPSRIARIEKGKRGQISYLFLTFSAHIFHILLLLKTHNLRGGSIYQWNW